MRSALRHITVLLLTAILFVTSTGVSIHCLYCYCRGEMVASLVKPEDPCHMAKVPTKDACCQTDLCQSDLTNADGDCSGCASTYVSLDSDFLGSSLDLKLSLPNIVLPGKPGVTELLSTSLSCLDWENDLPPPSGRELRCRIQSFQC